MAKSRRERFEKKQEIPKDEFIAMLRAPWYYREWAIIKTDIGYMVRPEAVGVDLRKTDLSGHELERVCLPQARLDNSDLRGANLAFSNLNKASLQSANLEGACLASTDLREAVLMRANLKNTMLDYTESARANYDDAILDSASLDAAVLIRASLAGASLKKASLRRANLGGADLTDANLQDANLENSCIAMASLHNANLTRANLSQVDLVSSNLKRANLSSANLSGANLSEANCISANFGRANLAGANLMNTVLNGANFKGANLTGAKVYGASVWDIITDRKTIQSDLIVNKEGDPLTVDSLNDAKFIYDILNGKKFGRTIDAARNKLVLILGKFDAERSILKILAEAARQENYIPVIYNFATESGDWDEIVNLIARMSGIVLYDLTSIASVPQELKGIIEPNPSIVAKAIIESGSRPYSMYENHFYKYPWVLPTFYYPQTSRKDLISVFRTEVITPAREKQKQLRGNR